MFDRPKLKVYPRGARLSGIPAGYQGVTWEHWRGAIPAEREAPKTIPAQAVAENLKFGRRKTA